MSKGGSKFGRRSNWFKINFLLEEKQKASMKLSNISEQMKSVVDTNLFAQASNLFPKFPSQNQPSPSSTSSSNSLDLMSPYTKLQPNHDLSLQTNPFYSAAMQYPLHPALLQTAIEGLSALYFNQNMLQQQQHINVKHEFESMSSNDDTDSDDTSNGAKRRATTATNLRISASPTPSSSSSSSIAAQSSDNQDYPMDLSIKSSSPRQVDFSISGLLKIPTA